jgi:alcohol dehydrogenase class IV
MRGFTFNTAPSIVFGSGAIERIGDIAVQKLGRRVALVTDAGLVRAGVIAPALASLKAAGVAVTVYDGIVADPPEAVVMEAVENARAHGAQGVIGLGGGSSMDVAKLVALLLKSGEELGDIYGVGGAKGPRLPLLLVPTTAGTGSEVTPISIVTTGAHEKKGVVSPVILPDIALLDPDLTLGLPPHVTAATGVDAMVHAIEAYTSTSANNNPVSRALACEALRLLGHNIRRAVHEGSVVEARSAMLLGSMLAGQAFANSPVAAVHALGLPNRRPLWGAARALERTRAALRDALQRRRLCRSVCGTRAPRFSRPCWGDRSGRRADLH